MQSIKSIFPLAKDRALLKYSALIRLMLKDADDSMTTTLNGTRPGGEQRKVSEALNFVRQQGQSLAGRMEVLFRESVERAMRTMYTDLRQGLTNLSADTLSLIDDETVNRQLEVGNLVQRLRDACDENLGRLNIIIAQIHGDADVHERENPFRPYLHARALYEALHEKVKDEEVGQVLFNHLANSLALHLSDYYASICEVFESSGIQARLLARPTKLKRHQRDQLAQQLAALNAKNAGVGGIGSGMGIGIGASTSMSSSLPQDFNQRVLPALERVIGLMQHWGSGPAGALSESPTTAQASQVALSDDLQAFLSKLFSQPSGSSGLPQQGENARFGQGSSPGIVAPPSLELLSRLNQLQQSAVAEQPAEDGIAPETNQLFKLGEQLSTEEASQKERIAIDVVGMLFEFILEDEQIPSAMRLQIGRLQIPFLKAAMLQPALLQSADHPARKLLNKLGSAAIGVAPDSAIGKNLGEEIARIVKRVLQEFEQDAALFSDCLGQFERFLEDQLHSADIEAAKSVQAAEEAERLSVLQHNTQTALRELIEPLQIDSRVSGFILDIWSRVLVRAAMQDAKSGAKDSPTSAQYRGILPELAWSAQEKQAPADRTALIRLLPGLVKRLKIGMLMIHLSEEECKAALDQLVAVHTQILRPNSDMDMSKKLPSLESLREQFGRLVVNPDTAVWTLSAPPAVSAETVENMLTDRGAAAELALQEEGEISADTDGAWLTQLQVGTCVQFVAADTSVLARLIWISKHHSLFIFKMDQNAKPLVYSAVSLVKALREGAIRLAEYAPVFERAVDSLMMGAEAIQAGRQR